MTVLYVPGDSAARSVGADDVAALLLAGAAARGHHDVELVRNGSRGMLWLEPLVEVNTSAGRVAYGPVTTADVDSLLDAGFLEGAHHPLYRGFTDEIEWLARQHRVTFARVGVIDPVSTVDYEAHGGLDGLRRALSLNGDEIVAEVLASGLQQLLFLPSIPLLLMRTVMQVAKLYPALTSSRCRRGFSGATRSRCRCERPVRPSRLRRALEERCAQR